MKNFVYAMYDKIAKDSTVFVAKNDGVALRMFENSVNKIPNTNPNDFELYILGTYCHETMELLSDYPKRILSSAEEEDNK